MIDLNSLSFISFEEREALPSICGVYFALDNKSNVLYIGKAVHLRNRWRYHHKIQTLAKLNCVKIAWIESSRKNYASLEIEMISTFNPIANANRDKISKTPTPNRSDSLVFKEIEEVFVKFSKYYNPSI